MKGLKEYIKKHGCHFTKELAHAVCKVNWDSQKIMKSAQKHVYYNVTGSTEGDMLYLMDMFHYFLSDQYTWNQSLRLTLMWVEDYHKTGGPFCTWMSRIVLNKEDFDFTHYI